MGATPTAIEIVRGRSFSMPAYWQTPTTPPVPIPITGYSILAQVVGPFGLETFASSVADEAGGEWLLTLTADQTVHIDTLSTLQITVTAPNGTEYDRDAPVNGVDR